MSNYILTKRDTCDKCYGYGSPSNPCEACDNKGYVEEEADFVDVLYKYSIKFEYPDTGW